MSKLLLKEWIVNKSTIFLSIVIIFLTSILLDNGQIPLFSVFLISCIYPFSATENDSSNNSDILINSLPVKTTTIVLSKYVFALLLSLVAVITSVVINAILPFFEGNELIEVALITSAIGWFIAVYYPLFYLVGKRFITYGMVAFFILSFAVIPLIINTGALNDFWNLIELSTITMSLFILGITAVVLIVSWYLSKQIYQKKKHL